jgi:N-acetylglucosaminyl-diphospho-decaprenol L-rhamnosyltransferase
MTDLAELSIIIVSWNVRELLRACLATLPRAAELIVVDNASWDGSAAMVAAEFPAARLVANSQNRGFTVGNNQGLALARGRYILLLNPDTLVHADALATLVDYLGTHPDAGVVGPQLRYRDGSVQSSRRRFPTLLTALFESTPLAWHWPPERNRWAQSYHRADQPADVEQEVDWLVGAALLTRRSVLDQVGCFDEGYFMYSEELDWQRRVKGAGWKIIYLPHAVITHYEGKSSEQVTAARNIRFNTSKVRYFRKHHGAAQAQTLRLALLVMFAVEWIIEAVKYMLDSRRAMRAERMQAYGQLLKSGLR